MADGASGSKPAWQHPCAPTHRCVRGSGGVKSKVRGRAYNVPGPLSIKEYPSSDFLTSRLYDEPSATGPSVSIAVPSADGPAPARRSIAAIPSTSRPAARSPENEKASPEPAGAGSGEATVEGTVRATARRSGR